MSSLNLQLSSKNLYSVSPLIGVYSSIRVDPAYVSKLLTSYDFSLLKVFEALKTENVLNISAQ